MADIVQNTQLSGDALQTMFSSGMTGMIILDLVVAATILLAHRAFLANERKINAPSSTPNQ